MMKMYIIKVAQLKIHFYIFIYSISNDSLRYREKIYTIINSLGRQNKSYEMQLRWKKQIAKKAVKMGKIYTVKRSLGEQNIVENISWKKYIL